VVAIVRSRLTAPALPAYTINLDPGEVVRTTLRQFVAVLPLGQHWLPGSSGPTVSLSARAWLLCAALFAVLLVGLCSAWRRLAPSGISARMLAAIGLWLWAVPAALVGVTSRWQTELPQGQGYLGVFVQSFGVALVVAAALIGLANARPATPLGHRVSALATYSLLTLVALAGALNATCNVLIGDAYRIV